MSKPFRERNPVAVGAGSLLVIALLMLAAFKAQYLPIIGGGDVYHAAFKEAGGLKKNDEVRIAGIRVGKVEDISLAGDHVDVQFRISEKSDFGTDTRAAIKVKTLLGAMFLALEPAGPGQLEPGSTIPVDRTSSPYDVVQAFTGLSETATQIDTGQLADALQTLAQLTANTPEEFRGALQGVSALSKSLASRNEQIGTLLKNLQKVSSVLNARDGDIVGLIKDSNVLFRAVVDRRQAVHNLLVSTSTLSKELTLLVQQSRADLKPSLTKLEHVVAVLNQNQDNLDNSLRLMAPFYRVFANTLGNGPWFDTYIQNLPPAPQVG
jgi:phospholipid/cholesterol/gamma-HCH transport system substrate-binding protein